MQQQHPHDPGGLERHNHRECVVCMLRRIEQTLTEVHACQRVDTKCRYSPTEFGRVLGNFGRRRLSASHVRRLIAQGVIAATKEPGGPGGKPKIWVSHEELLRFLNGGEDGEGHAGAFVPRPTLPPTLTAQAELRA